MRWIFSLLLVVFAALVTIPTLAAADAGHAPAVLESEAITSPAVHASLDVSAGTDVVFDVHEGFLIEQDRARLSRDPAHPASLRRRIGPSGFLSGIWRPFERTRDLDRLPTSSREFGPIRVLGPARLLRPS